MRLSFIFPSALTLLVLLAPIWALVLATPRRFARWRVWSSLLLRTLILLSMVGALAGTQLVRPVNAVTTIFLVDGSDSIALSQRARAEAFIQHALAGMPEQDRAAIVVFGERALVERSPSSERSLGQLITTPGGGATNIQDAVQLGLSLLPAEGHQRLVLLSDGGETTGDALAAARIAAAHNVPIDVVTLNSDADGPDAQIVGVELPTAAREGQRLRLRIDIDSNIATNGTLTIISPGGATLLNQPIPIAQGPQQRDIELPATLPGFTRYVVRLDVPGDARLENNIAEAYSFISGQPRVLLIEGTPDEARTLAQALGAAHIEAEIVAPAHAPTSLGDLSTYEAIILVDVPKTALPERTIAALPTYVHDLGRGLLMIGGDNSFGAGGWRRTPVEQALPVTMDIPSLLQTPPVSIVILIDISGSMGAEEGGRTKIALAAEGAMRVASLMRDEDELTIIPFDSQAQGVIGPLPGSHRDEAIAALSHLQPGNGGINIHDGLAEAMHHILQSDRPIRHIITITDGSDTVQQEGARELVQQLRDQHVTLTSIAVGNGDHVPFIRDIARIGGGRTFLTDKATNIPAILTDESHAVLTPYIIEEPFTPTRNAIHPILRGIESTPQLQGYVLTTPRQTATILLTTPRQTPLLAAWQYGLGRSLAWTSDLKPQWAKAWTTWEQFPRFSAQLISWLLPTQMPHNLALQTSSSGDTLTLNLQAQDDTGRARSGLQLTGRLLAADGSGSDVTMREISPGTYRAALRSLRPGAYLAQLIARDADGQTFGTVTAGALVPGSAEYRRRTANPALLSTIAHDTGGRLSPEPARVFDANATSLGAVQDIGLPLLWFALLLLPLDIALRRLLLHPDFIAPILQRTGLDRLLRSASRHHPHPSTPIAAEPAIDPTMTTPLAATPPTKTRPKKPQPDLERLREAQERARRRARGEE